MAKDQPSRHVSQSVKVKIMAMLPQMLTKAWNASPDLVVDTSQFLKCTGGSAEAINKMESAA